jgi:transcriptional regulator with XRE-family HTH domain
MWHSTYSFGLHPDEGAPMSRDFADLMHEIEEETRRAGPTAMREYAALGAGYRLAVSVIELRRSAGLTQRQLAAKSGLQQADISRIEAGEANPTLATIAALAYALGAELALTRSARGTRATRRSAKERPSGARQVRVRVAARGAGSRR